MLGIFSIWPSIYTRRAFKKHHSLIRLKKKLRQRGGALSTLISPSTLRIKIHFSSFTLHCNSLKLQIDVKNEKKRKRKRSFRVSKSKYFAPKGYETCELAGYQPICWQSVVCSLCRHTHISVPSTPVNPQWLFYWPRMSFTKHIPAVFSHSYQISYSKSKESKTLIFPRYTHSWVLQERVIPCRPPVPTTCAFHIHLCSATCYSHLVRQMKWKRVIGEKEQIGSGYKWSLVSGRRSLLWR